ncbi:hypothetical protein Nepgr_020584 [Nepenthes gracilis]|uniref:Uncharacterized protein n=1 Tax=Nepenthes gracilis TaxID=150966 RepID=A0AAD3SWD0_NEPGR|nr:hypothetical protein Nepgr_020584 [Nepenthes gracilis]
MSFAPEVIMQNNTEAVTFFEKDLMNLCQNITLDSARVVFLSDYRCVLPLVNVTTAIIQSRSDKVVPSDVPVYMKQHLGIPTELKILSTDGHFPMLTVPSLLLDFLKEVLGVEKKQTKA